jgi:hypothetical protein
MKQKCQVWVGIFFFTLDLFGFCVMLLTHHRVDHERKIRSRRQRTDIGKYSFVNRTIEDWNELLAEVLETLPCKQNTLKKRVRKAIIEVR